MVQQGGLKLNSITMEDDYISIALDKTSAWSSIQIDSPGEAGDTRAGNFYIQGSNDDLTYTNLVFPVDSLGTPGTAIPVVTQTALNVLIDIYSNCKFIRLFYDATSGAGAFTASVVLFKHRVG